jgi:hypothetical protein
MHGLRFRLRFRVRTILLLVSLAALIMTIEVARERRAGFRGAAKALSAMEADARVQADGAAGSAAYHRHTVARGVLDEPTAALWLARAARLDAQADDWRRQADSFGRSRHAYERAAEECWIK